MEDKMLDTNSRRQTLGDVKCGEITVCLAQAKYRTNSFKWKTKLDGSSLHCFFCNSNLKKHMFFEGIKTK